jgi:ABC-2 type transport system ATP-binding protein
MIEIHGITKRFKHIVAVNNLELMVHEGDIFGYIGPNGAGKTTTIRILATLLRPDEGYATIGGFNILTQPSQVKHVIGYMPDFFGVYDDMKVWEYMDFFASAHHVERWKRKKIIDDILELTDLIGKRDEYVEALSRGMKQRLCLAKTLVHDPQVLLLDEPASGLDPRARIEFRELLKELQRMNKTILISSHILTELSDFCNTIGIIEQGVLLCSGEVKEIIDRLQGARVVEVKVRDDAAHAEEVLVQHPSVTRVHRDGNQLTIEVPLDVEDTSFVTELLVQNGVKVVGVQESAADLEDVFMKITKGAVQ